MIRAGDVLENPVTGERMIFRKTSAETGGEAVVIECIVRPKGVVAATHVHPSQDERFEVLSGEVGFRVGKEEVVASAGERMHVRPGRRTSSGTQATRTRTSSARSGRRCSSSR